MGSPRWFLDAPSHLYMRSCPSVGPSVRRSVRPLVPRYFRRWKSRILGASCAVYPALFWFFFWGVSGGGWVTIAMYYRWLSLNRRIYEWFPRPDPFHSAGTSQPGESPVTTADASSAANASGAAGGGNGNTSNSTSSNQVGGKNRMLWIGSLGYKVVPLLIVFASRRLTNPNAPSRRNQR